MIGLSRTTEQEELRASIRGALSGRSEPATHGDFDVRTWVALTHEIGVSTIAVSEERGGAGYGLGELSVLFEEAGRSLTTLPALATLGLAQPLLSRCKGPAAEEAETRIIEGAPATVVVNSLQADPLRSLTIRAVQTDGSWQLDGTVNAVLFGHCADLFIVPARLDGGVGLFLVDPAATQRTVTVGLDLTQPTAEVQFSSTFGRRLDAEGEPKEAISYAFAFASVANAADSLGGAQACLSRTVQYAKTREQFGRPIGSFQAIKHRLADVSLAVRRAESLVMNAAVNAAASPRFELDAAAAKATAAEAYLLASKEAIQLHGGIGFTWELDAHFHFKRALTNDLTLGDVRTQRMRIGAVLRASVDDADSPFSGAVEPLGSSLRNS